MNQPDSREIESGTGSPRPSGVGSIGSAQTTNGTAIAALIFSLVFAPIGVVLGYVARRQIKRTGEGGRGLATAALIIGWIFTSIPLIILLIMMLMLTVGCWHNTNFCVR